MKPTYTRQGRKAAARDALRISELSDEEFAAIGAAEVPAEYAHLDEELPPSPQLCQEHPPDHAKEP
jgi:hypothetical protein